MNTMDDFVDLIREEIGLNLTLADLNSVFDDIPGWDSINLLRLLVVLEQKYGYSMSMADVLEVPNLASLFDMVECR